MSNNNVITGLANCTAHPKSITRIAIFGDCGVGKSCIVERFTNNTFSTDCNMTIGFNVMTKDQSDDVFDPKLFIFIDMSGNSSFAVLRKSCYKGVKFFLAVCDITSISTLIIL